ncbi:MAG: hypothetical protein ACLPWD_06550 [Methanobacterium sp.]
MIQARQVNSKKMSYEDYLGNITKDYNADDKVKEVARQNILYKSKHQGFGCSEMQRQALLRKTQNTVFNKRESVLAPLFEQLKNVNAGLFAPIIQFSSANKGEQGQIIIINTKDNSYFIQNYDKSKFDAGRLNNLIHQNLVGSQFIIAWYNGNDPRYKNVFDPILKTLFVEPRLKGILDDLAGNGKNKGTLSIEAPPMMESINYKSRNTSGNTSGNVSPKISEIPVISTGPEGATIEVLDMKQQDDIIINEIYEYWVKKKNDSERLTSLMNLKENDLKDIITNQKKAMFLSIYKIYEKYKSKNDKEKNDIINNIYDLPYVYDRSEKSQWTMYELAKTTEYIWALYNYIKPLFANLKQYGNVQEKNVAYGFYESIVFDLDQISRVVKGIIRHPNAIEATDEIIGSYKESYTLDKPLIETNMFEKIEDGGIELINKNYRQAFKNYFNKNYKEVDANLSLYNDEAESAIKKKVDNSEALKSLKEQKQKLDEMYLSSKSSKNYEEIKIGGEKKKKKETVKVEGPVKEKISLKNLYKKYINPKKEEPP